MNSQLGTLIKKNKILTALNVRSQDVELLGLFNAISHHATDIARILLVEK